MELTTGEQKVKRVVLAVVVGILAIGTVALGYLYYNENVDKKTLADQNKILEDQYNTILEKNQSEIDELTGGASSLSGEKTTLEGQNATLKKKNDEYAAGMATIKAYNDMFKYYNTVIDTHDGFTGWTDAEFQTGKSLAEKTGNSSYVSTVNWAWYETSVPPFDRALRFQIETAAGIEGGIK
jgi:hypothetical protein